MQDVLICGAGPTGLVLALWLTRQGVGVRIIDKSQGPGLTSRAMVVQSRTLELYRQLELADTVVAAGHPNEAVNLWALGRRAARLSLGDAGADITPYPFLLIFPQDQHEKLLVERLDRLGVRVERDTELLGFDQDEARVMARIKEADGSVTSAPYRYLAGCDGARSVVRHVLGSGFQGGTYKHVFYVADVAAHGIDRAGEAHLAFDEGDFVAVFPYGQKGRSRLIGTVREDRLQDGTMPTFADVGHTAADRLGLRVDGVEWFSTYRVHHRVTDRFRIGRAFLLGDAAHVHSPVGGQGMNTGIGDAVNLAWKLAAALRLGGHDRLLDTYEIERMAFARQLVDTTDRVFSVVTADGSLAEFARTRLAPPLASAAYRLAGVRRLLFRTVSQTAVHYPDSPLSSGRTGPVKGGDRLPWASSPGQDTHEALRRIAWGLHVVGAPDPAAAAWASRENVQIHQYEPAEPLARAGFESGTCYLVRPDGYVAVAGSPADLDAFSSDWKLFTSSAWTASEGIHRP